MRMSVSLRVVVDDGLRRRRRQKSEGRRAEMEQKLQDAQKRLDAAAREVADLSMSLSDDVMPRVMHFTGHAGAAMLGVIIGSATQRHARRRRRNPQRQPRRWGGRARAESRRCTDRDQWQVAESSDDESPRSKLLRRCATSSRATRSA